MASIIDSGSSSSMMNTDPDAIVTTNGSVKCESCGCCCSSHHHEKKEDVGGSSGSGVGGAAAGAGTGGGGADATSKDYYFDSYSHFGIHEEMLKDNVRTLSYMHAIEHNKHLFQGKVVMDVGCGTGILSMFAARAGAAKVIGIECSSIAVQAQQIIDANGYTDTITLIKAKCEDIKELPDGIEKVDIMISEWMGYFLLYESMLDTVIYARDRWLKLGGLLLPDKATLYVGGIEDEAYKREKIDFWDQVYGFDMKVIKEIALTEPLVDVVEGKSIVTDCKPVLKLDLLSCTVDDLKFTADFSLTAHRNDHIQALISYFDCSFSQLHKPVHFSTAPFSEYTHWKQTVFYLRDDITICKGETLNGQITVKPNAGNKRDLDIDLRVTVDGQWCKTDFAQAYRLR